MIFEYTVSYNFDVTGTVFWFFIVSFVIFVTSYFADLTLEKRPWLYAAIMAFVIGLLLVLNHFLFFPFSFSFGFGSDNSLLGFFISIYYVVAILPVLFSFYGVLGYLFDKKDKISALVLVTIVFAALMYFNNSENDFEIWYSLFVCILSGIGVKRLFFEGYKVKETVSEAENTETEEVIIEEINEPGIANVVSIPAGKIEESKIKEVSFKAFDKTESVKAPLEEAKKEIKFLDNPLPVPKKHVKKSIDYAFEPEADMMNYDIEISADDDFDIK